MNEFKAEDSFNITGRGLCFTGRTTRIFGNREELTRYYANQLCLINGKEWYVTGVESYLRMGPMPLGDGIGLLVREYPFPPQP